MCYYRRTGGYVLQSLGEGPNLGEPSRTERSPRGQLFEAGLLKDKNGIRLEAHLGCEDSHREDRGMDNEVDGKR